MNTYKQHVIELYNARTDYDHEEATQHPQEALDLLQYVPVQTGQKILDIATGTGLVAIPAAFKVGSAGYVTGVDMTPGMLHQARQKIAAANLQNIELIEADVEQINFSDNSFDVIFCCSAIVLLTDILGSLQKWYRFLKPGGFFAFTCPPATAHMAPVYINICTRVLGISPPHMFATLGTPENCQNVLQKAGFQDIEIKIQHRRKYRNFSHQKLSEKVINLIFKGSPLLSNLSSAQLDQLQVEYQAEIEKLTTSQGLWEDNTAFFVRGRK